MGCHFYGLVGLSYAFWRLSAIFELPADPARVCKPIGSFGAALEAFPWASRGPSPRASWTACGTFGGSLRLSGRPLGRVLG
eukprot:4982149-Pyramimonas_sp.AAC.1